MESDSSSFKKIVIKNTVTDLLLKAFAVFILFYVFISISNR